MGQTGLDADEHDRARAEHIRLQIDGWIARLTFARPTRRNALTFDMMVEIKDAFLRVGAYTIAGRRSTARSRRSVPESRAEGGASTSSIARFVRRKPWM